LNLNEVILAQGSNPVSRCRSFFLFVAPTLPLKPTCHRLETRWHPPLPEPFCAR
jgi:hypothetical protein